MAYPVKADIIAMFRHTVEAIRPFADSNFVKVAFHSDVDALQVSYHPEEIMVELARLLCRVITYTPSGYEVSLAVGLPDQAEGNALTARITNTGVNLGHMPEITSGLRLPVAVIPQSGSGACFELSLALDTEEETVSAKEKGGAKENSGYQIPAFYQKLRKHMQAYAASMKSLEEAVAREHSRRDQVFLKKINAVILANLGDEHFDVRALGRGLALSRSQLYRRLKRLACLSPSQYIRFVRLQKAKELLESGEVTVGEAAFRTGFVDKSHFARMFHRQFGFNPSFIKHTRTNKT